MKPLLLWGALILKLVAQTGLAQPQAAPLMPPRFDVHSLEVCVKQVSESKGVIELINISGPEIKLWDNSSSWGEFSYRLEFIDLSTKTHYLVVRRLEGRTMNVPKGVLIRKGDKLSIEFDLRDGTWRVPDSLPMDAAKLRVRAWYKPVRMEDEEYVAGKHAVTLDAFVGDWCQWNDSGSP